MEFGKFGLNTKILSALSDMGFSSPTPIQDNAIPLLLQGEDIIGQAQTGTGKTAAFGIFILERLLEGHGAQHGKAVPMALILTPTRELCMQVKEELSSLGKYSGAKIIAVYGGQEIEKQLAPLASGVDIVVGTPGRIIDHLQRGSLDLSRAGIVVLDEADRMLDMGFINDVETILQKTPPSRQTLLFSATMPDPILHLSKKYMRSPQHIKVSEDSLTVQNVEQKYSIVERQTRLRALIAYLRIENPPLAIIFARTKMGADRLNGILLDRGFKAMALHGDLSQNRRDRVMRGFREGHFHILVATDLAARGLDVDDVSHVINYDIPQEPFTYVHRVGRTGRMGKTGKALTLIFSDQENELIMMQKAAQTHIEKIDIDLSQSGPAPALGRRDGDGFGQERGDYRGSHGGGHFSRRGPSGYSGERQSDSHGHSGGRFSREGGSYRGSHGEGRRFSGGSSDSGGSGRFGREGGRFHDRREGSGGFGGRRSSGGRDSRRRQTHKDSSPHRSSRGGVSYTGRTR